MWVHVLGVLGIVVFVLVNALFVAAEFAIVRVRRTRVDELEQEQARGAGSLKHAVSHLDDAIATTQLGITLIAVALGAIGEPSLANVIEVPLRHIGSGHAHALSHTIAVAVAFVAVSFLDAVLGELVPKAIALEHPEPAALRLARPLILFQTVMRPLVWLMNTTGNAVVRALRVRPATGRARVPSVRELKMLVEQTEGAGNLDPTQADVVEAALDLRTKRVRDVMVPRERVQQIEAEMPTDALIHVLRESKRTRLPVYSAIDKDWIGVAVTKVMLLNYLERGELDVRGSTYRPMIFHHAAPVPRVLRAFLEKRQHMAFVADDSGSKVGIVTLEDVLEELVGEIEDELDVNAARKKS